MNEIRLKEWEIVTQRRRDFYTYEAQATALAAGGSATDTINIEADSIFILQKLAFQADNAGAQYTRSTAPIPNATVLITDTGSGRQLMSDPIPIANLFGSGELPFILPNPRLFERNSTIQVAFTSFDAAATPTIRLAFIGYKLYSNR